MCDFYILSICSWVYFNNYIIFLSHKYKVTVKYATGLLIFTNFDTITGETNLLFWHLTSKGKNKFF